MKKKFSIIVPIYNSEKYISKTIDSLLTQSYSEYEIILVNDGSTDSSYDICKKIGNTNKNIKIINQKNQGVSIARNNGILNAEGEYIIFIDSDDKLNPDTLSICDNYLMQEDYDLIIYNYFTNKMGPNENINFFTNTKVSVDEAYKNLINLKGFEGYVWNKVYKTEILMQMLSKEGLFDSDIHICEDLLFNSKYIGYCNSIIKIEDELYFYNIGNEESITNNIVNINERNLSIIEAYRRIIELYNKHSPENLDFLYYNYMKILLKFKYLFYLENRKYDYDNLLKFLFNNIIKSNKIKFLQKVVISFRYIFPIISQKIKEKVSK